MCRVKLLCSMALCAALLSPSAKAEQPVDEGLWGSNWMSGGYHQYDLQLSERVGLSLDWQGSRVAGLSLSYSSQFLAEPAAAFGLSPEEPLTFRVTLRGWELFESNGDRGMDFFSLDRIRDREIRRQLVMISVSKRF